ncbi:MAG: hypothetical protein HC853_03345 [Anaerolineae bacterium]|nr:hypothetical protein [Anaerolineae bacterium]
MVGLPETMIAPLASVGFTGGSSTAYGARAYAIEGTDANSALSARVKSKESVLCMCLMCMC